MTVQRQSKVVIFKETANYLLRESWQLVDANFFRFQNKARRDLPEPVQLRVAINADYKVSARL